MALMAYAVLVLIIGSILGLWSAPRFAGHVG